MIDPELRVSAIGERALLRHLWSRIPADESLVVGVGDDAAAVETPGTTLIATATLVEGVHFNLDWMPPRMLGRKAIAASVSEIAAMGGVPRHATVSACFGADHDMAVADGLYDGLLERSAEVGVAIVGGEVVVGAGALIVTVTLLGICDHPVRRDGARPGDRLGVTGYPGMAAAGLRLLSQGGRLGEEGEIESTGIWVRSSSLSVARCLQAQLDPQPPWAFARSLAEQGMVQAATGLSLGLSEDLTALCDRSGVAAIVDAAALPVHEDVRAFERSWGGDARQLALHGGGDYQLLVAIAPEHLAAVAELAGVWNVSFTIIGALEEGRPGITLLAEGGRTPLVPASVDAPARLRD